MSIRFVIPAGASPNDVAWDHRPETWAELAAEGGAGIIIVNIDSQWCIDNNVGGLGFCTENSGPFEYVEVGN